MGRAVVKLLLIGEVVLLIRHLRQFPAKKMSLKLIKHLIKSNKE